MQQTPTILGFPERAAADASFSNIIKRSSIKSSVKATAGENRVIAKSLSDTFNTILNRIFSLLPFFLIVLVFLFAFKVNCVQLS